MGHMSGAQTLSLVACLALLQRLPDSVLIQWQTALRVFAPFGESRPRKGPFCLGIKKEANSVQPLFVMCCVLLSSL